MDVYGRFRLIDSFDYRGLKVEIFKAEKGRKHCKIQHEYRERRCQACGAKMRARAVYVVHVEGQSIDIDCDDLAEAVEMAKAFIDDQFDDDENDDADAVFSAPKAPNERDAKSPADVSGGRAKLVSMIKKMGWDKRALALIRKGSQGRSEKGRS